MSEQAIWKKEISAELLNKQNRGTVNEHLGMEFTEVGATTLSGRIKVDERTRQPFGILHGGVSVVLAETLGSAGAYHAVPEGYVGVGLDVNANHIRAVKEGYVYGTATAVHLGRTTQVWEIKLTDEQGRLTCTSRLTIAVVKQG